MKDTTFSRDWYVVQAYGGKDEPSSQRSIIPRTKATPSWLAQIKNKLRTNIFNFFVPATIVVTIMGKAILSVLHVTMLLMTANHRMERLDMVHAGRVRSSVVDGSKFNWLPSALKQLMLHADKNAKVSMKKAFIDIKGVHKQQLFSY